ncbi:MarR family winged helix-turn-helix transcriptional regulator, partial [Nostocoides japonicum]|uniref:MarR family winged helix-turn-helix transcriptional regulator n=1 Tax=Nostocoides japonicum TaxID=99481 RepID=UPI0038996C14
LAPQPPRRVPHTAARLEGRGWVTREACLSDRRGVELVLTADGREAVEEMARVHVASVREHLVDLVSREELLGLGRAMSRVRDLGCAQARAAGLVPDADSDGAGCGGVTDPDRAAASEPPPCPGAPADVVRAADSDLVAGPGTTEDSGRSAEQA